MFARFEWTEELSVNDPVIDRQHQALFAHTNNLLELVVSEKELTMDLVSETLGFLDDYINNHFSYEEQYMEKHQYPDLENHRHLHKAFQQHYQSLKNQLRSSKPDTVLIGKLESYLGQWLVRHISEEDKKYARFIQEQNMPNNQTS